MSQSVAVRPLNHLACIMDGNRRWARQHNRSLLYSDDSKKAVHAAVAFCQKQNIQHLSLFALSLENQKKRDNELVQRLYDVLFDVCTTDRDRLCDENVRVRFIGMRSVFPSHLRPVMEALERDTAQATGLQLNILFCYGSQQEITQATKCIARKVAQKELAVEEITEHTIAEHLWLSHAPPPDLIIRTSGVSRLSNFLLFQAAYTELLFVDYFWPEVTEEKLQDCLITFSGIARNYGK